MGFRTYSIYASLLVSGAIVSGSSNQPNFSSELQPCPAATCDGKPDGWTVYSSTDRLNVCEQPILLDFAIYNPLADPKTSVKLRTCTAGDPGDIGNALAPGDSHSNRSPQKGKRDASCIAGAEQKKASLELLVSNQRGHSLLQDAASVLDSAQKYLADASNCEETFIAGSNKGAAVGVYIGSAIEKRSSITPAIQRLIAASGSGNSPQTALIQLCGGRTGDHTFGIIIDGSGDMAAVQSAIKAWSDATCVKDTAGTSKPADLVISEVPFQSLNDTVEKTKNAEIPIDTRSLWPRSDCRTQTVVSGDSCGSLASKCGISASDFTKYNPQKNLCSTLAVGQRVCCSAGTLPDIRPKPNSDGSCASYTVKSGDTCSSIAAKNGLNVTDIATFNDKTTWGWSGCNNLMAGVSICLSKGRPPLPAPQSNAVCGPIKPGTKAPTDGTNITNLNPCPLNACCNVWGQCGITPSFCTQDNGPTGNPGTAPPGENGCISNCGTNITHSGSSTGFQRIGYYESWNFDRPCQVMGVSSIDASYTHVHWAFGVLTDSFDITVNDTYQQFSQFKALKAKRILSLGGWGYSTDIATYDKLREAMSPANAATFATNIVNFLNKNNLDGIDFDWEYPGATDIPGTPPGQASDGPNYLSFLQTLRGKMPAGKTASIAAPASYWYLKNFPIANMSHVLDYMVYMTYDLHGQWDYGNTFSQEGCPAGNCLRSHINITETNYALAMITKAGVPASKLNVGISAYGRSFGMTNPSCTGPMCTYTGPASGATPGRCTGTAGYISNAEIFEVSKNRTVGAHYDKASDSDIVTYGSNQWVAYMSPATRTSRTSYYKGLGFGGVTDWAIDLNEGVGSARPNTTASATISRPVTTLLSSKAVSTQLSSRSAVTSLPSGSTATQLSSRPATTPLSSRSATTGSTPTPAPSKSDPGAAGPSQQSQPGAASPSQQGQSGAASPSKTVRP